MIVFQQDTTLDRCMPGSLHVLSACCGRKICRVRIRVVKQPQAHFDPQNVGHQRVDHRLQRRGVRTVPGHRAGLVEQVRTLAISSHAGRIIDPRDLRARRFDMAIDLQGLLKSGLLTWSSGAAQRIGLGSREGSRFLMHRVVARGGDPRRIGSEYLFLAETLGLPVRYVGMGEKVEDLAVFSADQFVDALFADWTGGEPDQESQIHDASS